MTGNVTRYRGAQPFGDDAISRSTFFGREAAAETLTNQILANRLVVVYAKSGMGKSSLLNAGVAPRLRAADCQPLLLRINDTAAGPVSALLAGVRAEAQRQDVEYVDGDSGSAWAFFKTVEFWRGDRLLTPVLVLDQFEELFTLHAPRARDDFLAALGPLVRGVPPLSGVPQGLSDAAPALHVVLSLREEFLGVLDDAADRIPPILDHRFRLMPLGREDAAAAMTGPAALDDPALQTRPFVLAPGFVDGVLDYLTLKDAGLERRQVEPFHLQLICQRVEDQVAGRREPLQRPFDMRDFGGAAAMSSTLAAFYTRAIQSVSERALRPAARRLCEEFLISPEGRRLSLEQLEIRKQLRLSEQALQQLVDSRLLRTDRRSDSTYYELSHDTLVEPILATRRVQALAFGWAAIAAGAVGMAACLLLTLALTGAFLSQEVPHDGGEMIGVLFVLVASAALVLVPWRLLRSGLRTHRRFGRRKLGQAALPATRFVSLPQRLAARTLQTLGYGLKAFTAGVAVLVTLVVALLFAGHGTLPDWLGAARGTGLDAIYAHPTTEVGWAVVQLVVLWLFARGLCQAALWLLAEPQTAPGFDVAAGRRWRVVWQSAALRDAAGALALLAAVGGFMLLWRCAGADGALPDWLPRGLVSDDFRQSCRRVHAGGWGGFEDLIIGLFLVGLVYLSAARGVLRWRRSGSNAR